MATMSGEVNRKAVVMIFLLAISGYSEAFILNAKRVLMIDQYNSIILFQCFLERKLEL